MSHRGVSHLSLGSHFVVNRVIVVRDFREFDGARLVIYQSEMPGKKT